MTVFDLYNELSFGGGSKKKKKKKKSTRRAKSAYSRGGTEHMAIVKEWQDNTGKGYASGGGGGDIPH